MPQRPIVGFATPIPFVWVVALLLSGNVGALSQELASEWPPRPIQDEGFRLGFALNKSPLATENPLVYWTASGPALEWRPALNGRQIKPSANEFRRRFISLQRSAEPKQVVGILITKMDDQAAFAAGLLAYRTLLRLGFTPQMDDDVDRLTYRRFQGCQCLLVWQRRTPLDDRQRTAITKFTKRGGRVFIDGETTALVPHAERLAVSADTFNPAFTTKVQEAGETRTFVYEDSWHEQLAPKLLEAMNDKEHAFMVSTLGAKTEVALMELNAGDDVRYVVAINDTRKTPTLDWLPVKEMLDYRKDVVGTDIIYDVTGEFMQGKARPFECDLSEIPVRLYAMLPYQAEKISVQATQKVLLKSSAERAERIRVERGASETDWSGLIGRVFRPSQGKPGVNVEIEFQDASGKRIPGALPFHLTLLSPDRHSRFSSYCASDRVGLFSATVPFPIDAAPGKWSLVVRSQLTGDEVTLPIDVLPFDEAAAKKDPRPNSLPTGVGEKPKLTDEGRTVKSNPQPWKIESRPQR